MTDDKMREAFETDMSEGGKWPKAIERSSNGTYRLMSAASAWGTWQRAWQAATRAAVPECWKVVPVEPTDAMLNAMRNQIDFDRSGQITSELEDPSQTSLIVDGEEIGPCGTTLRVDMTDAYSAALTAAPEAP